MADTVMQENGLEGRETAPLVSLVLVVLGLLSAVVGLVLFAGSEQTGKSFAWEFASPVTAALIGAGFLGAVPMMLGAAMRDHWEEVRIAVLPALLLVSGLLVVTVMHLGETRVGGGPVIAYVLSLGWLAAMAALPFAILAALAAQSREPALPMERRFPIPRWALPAIAVEGASGLGLGLALLVEPGWWIPMLPWDLQVVDARALGVWGLVLGVALLQALVEDDLDRVRPGLAGVMMIGALGLAALAWHHGSITSQGWPTIAAVALVGGMFLTGLVGLVLHRRAVREQAVPTAV
ncbi:hypothetical protein [Nocardioides sp. Soil796]|uniref:hypothetical protein n=1 Tax=Nocardioides sp. Soil796 TaxID=1736412 RepID=UPI00070FA129|nr:hypothetical protein [Nocardioides sp. Soil796]